MTKISETRLETWLDRFQVDVSSARLSRLEYAILNRVKYDEQHLFAPMDIKHSLGTVSAACAFAAIILLVSQWQTSADSINFFNYMLTSSTPYWGY